MWILLKKHTVMTCLLILSVSVKGISTDEPGRITFEEALQLTLQHNYLLRQSDHHLLQMEEEKKVPNGLAFPKISLNGSFMTMEERIHFDLTPVRDAITPLYQTLGTYGVFSGVANPDPATNGAMPFLPENLSTQLVRKKMTDGLQAVQSADWDLTIQEKTFGSLSAGFIWPIFMGGKIGAAKRAASIKYETVGIEHQRKVSELTNELIDRYFGMVLATQSQRVRLAVRETMQQHLKDADALQKLGQIARVEWLNAKLNQADAEREYQKSVRQLDMVRNALMNTLAFEKLQNVEPVSQLFYLDSLESIDYFYEMARLKSPLLAEIAKKKELAEEGYLAEKGGRLPSLALTGMYELANKNLSPYLPGYMVGIGMKWNLFEGRSVNHKLKACSYQKMEAGDFYQKASADIRTAIHKHYQELGMYREQLKMLDAAMDLANEYVRVRNKAFQEGMATSTQVADASLLLAKAKTDRLQAMYNYDVALSRLLAYAGISDQFPRYMKQAEAGMEKPKTAQPE